MKYIVYGLIDPTTRLIRYVGKSSTGLNRPRQHRTPGNRKDGTHRDHWVGALLAAGLDYEITVLEIHDNQYDLPDAERWWIAYGRASDWPLTNHTDGGDGTPGRKHSAETKAKISAKAIGRTVGAYARSRIGAAATGRVKSEEELQKMREAATGRVKSDEELAKMSAAATAAMTPERRELIGNQHRGMKHTEDTKQRIADTMRGRPVSESTRDKLRVTSSLRVVTDETRARMRAGQARRHAKKAA